MADLISVGLGVSTSKTEAISHVVESRKSVICTLKEAKIVPVDNSKLLGSSLFDGMFRHILCVKM